MKIQVKLIIEMMVIFKRITEKIFKILLVTLKGLKTILIIVIT